jgi:hypothetical protein
MAHIQSGEIYRILNAKSGTIIDLSGGDNKSSTSGFHEVYRLMD